MKYILYLLFLLFIPFIGQAQDKGFKPVTGGTAPAGTERRLALVIGNKDYQRVRPLKNPLNDATDMSRVLASLGFEVITVTNANFQQLTAGLNCFKDKLTTSDVALFYYSGHGVGYAGKNYLLPVDADIRCLEQAAEYGIPLNQILSDLASRQVRNSFVLLDACRNLPELATCDNNKRDLTTQSGLVKPNNPRGSMVVFATDEGSTADDNINGRNGLFTEALLKYLVEPNISIRTILDKTSLAVEEKSGRRQSPGRYDKLLGDFVFVQTAAAPSTITGNLPEPTRPIPSVSAPDADLAQSNITQGNQAYENKDYNRAFKLLSAHQDLLDASSQANLGYMYEKGYGVDVNKTLALKWYRKAADQGFARGQNDLGDMYYHGEGGLSVDKAEAVRWFRKAADQGNANAQFNLRNTYHNGEGVLSVDVETAIRYFQLAARQGNGGAKKVLIRLGKTW